MLMTKGPFPCGVRTLANGGTVASLWTPLVTDMTNQRNSCLDCWICCKWLKFFRTYEESMAVLLNQQFGDFGTTTDCVPILWSSNDQEFTVLDP